MRPSSKAKIFLVLVISLALSGGVVLAQPHTTTYSLQSYGFGSGGTAGSSTSSYSLEGISGELSGQTSTTSTYGLKPGYIETQQSNVPKVTLTNPSNYYDKLNFVIDQQNNPNDALYALQVKVNDATCDFTTGTIMYVKSDDTLTSTLTTAEYHTYTFWGGAGGANIIGLSPSTNYCMRAKATQGQFTESAYGPSSSAATVGQSISFCLYTSDGSCLSSSHATSFSGLVAGTPVPGSNNLNLSFDTNADSGGSVFIYSNGKLQSTSAPSGTITSATADLSSALSGYGAQVTSTNQASGGPFLKQSPYDGSANSVGILSTTIIPILDSTSPVTGASASIQLQAKASSVTLAANDYADIVTVIAAARF